MKYYIITGTSKGIGHAMVRQLAGPHSTIFCISRSGTDLSGISSHKDQIHDIKQDLSKIAEIDRMMDGIFSRIDCAGADGIYLVNNAGLIDPVSAVEDSATADIERHVQVNLVAPMRTTSLFIAHTTGASCRKVVANVSSGAALKPYRGWGVYCAAKAGLDMFTRVAGLEQSDASAAGKTPVIVYAVAPGKVDTNMQATLRSHDTKDFPDRDTFVEFYETGALTPPDKAAEMMIRTLDSPALKTGDVIDIRKFSP
jgi:benzil reductase ((S)-benzoin forming)